MSESQLISDPADWHLTLNVTKFTNPLLCLDVEIIQSRCFKSCYMLLSVIAYIWICWHHCSMRMLGRRPQTPVDVCMKLIDSPQRSCWHLKNTVCLQNCTFKSSHCTVYVCIWIGCLKQPPSLHNPHSLRSESPVLRCHRNAIIWWQTAGVKTDFAILHQNVMICALDLILP